MNCLTTSWKDDFLERQSCYSVQFPSNRPEILWPVLCQFLRCCLSNATTEEFAVFMMVKTHPSIVFMGDGLANRT